MLPILPTLISKLWGVGDQGALLGSSVFGLGRDLAKGGKMVTAVAREGSGGAVAMALRADVAR